jgi:hypothetical protein
LAARRWLSCCRVFQAVRMRWLRTMSRVVVDAEHSVDVDQKKWPQTFTVHTAHRSQNVGPRRPCTSARSSHSESALPKPSRPCSDSAA